MVKTPPISPSPYYSSSKVHDQQGPTDRPCPRLECGRRGLLQAGVTCDEVWEQPPWGLSSVNSVSSPQISFIIVIISHILVIRRFSFRGLTMLALHWPLLLQQSFKVCVIPGVQPPWICALVLP